MDIVDRDTGQPLCPLCGVAMPLVRTTLRANAALHRFACVPCGVSFAEVAPAVIPPAAHAPADHMFGALT